MSKNSYSAIVKKMKNWHRSRSPPKVKYF